MLDVSVAGTVDRLRAVWTKYATHRKALAELRPLTRTGRRDDRAAAPAVKTDLERTLTTMAHAIKNYADYAERPGIFARLRKSFTDYRAYLATYDELNALSNRELADLDLSRLDVRRIALESVYGC